MFFKQHWQVKPATNAATHAVQPLLVVGEQAVVDKVLSQDGEFADSASRACWGEQFAADEAGHFIINPQHTADWTALFEKIAPVPETILFFSEGCQYVAT